MGMNCTINFPIFAFQIWLLILGEDLHRKRRSVDYSSSIWGMGRGIYSECQFHFEPFFAWVDWVEAFWSSLGYQVARQRPCCLGLLWHLWKYWERGKNTMLYMTQKTNVHFFDKCIIMLTCIQCIHELFFSEKQCNIKKSPAVSSVAKTLWRRGRW